MELVYIIFVIAVLDSLLVGVFAKEYCEPGKECWPKIDEIEKFKSYLTSTDKDCHGLPTFSSIDEPGSIM